MDESKQPRDSTGKLLTQYRADGPLPIPTEERARGGAHGIRTPRAEDALPQVSRSAVFIAHGMGQQIPFQTLDDIAWGLLKIDLETCQQMNRSAPRPKVQTIQVGEARLQRVELTLCDGPGKDRKVDIYEGYWAPLVEGEVSLRDVIGFLFRAAWNGVANGSRSFQRWVFGEFRDFGSTGSTVQYLLVALLVILALIVMNATIVTIVAARSPLSQRPEWFSDGLFADLSTIFNGVLLGLLALALPVSVSIDIRKRGWSSVLRRVMARASWFGMGIALTVLVLAGLVCIPLLFTLHLRSAQQYRSAPELLKQWIGEAAVERFNAGFETTLLLALAIALLVAVAWLVKALCTKKRLEASSPGQGEAGGKPVLLVISILFVLALSAGWFFSAHLVELFGEGSLRTFRRGVSWPLLIAASMAIRRLLVQYPGDVAAYISPHTLDRFNELRKEIKDCVRQQAQAVFALKEGGRFVYGKIYIVGHSLGSVVVYDTLNQLIVQDELTKREMTENPTARERLLYVLDRTKLLLTFGSPLDKIAFLFALQGSKTSETREALATEVQPMIQNPGFRSFPWINIHSLEDIISGDLDFFDPPPAFAEAAGPIVAHEAVRAWVEQRNGAPARIKGADLKRNPLQLRLSFPGQKEPEPLERIEWEEFFTVFESAHLALSHPKEAGSTDFQYAFVSRHRVVNLIDPEATTVLVSHTEYWRNPLLFEQLYKSLMA